MSFDERIGHVYGLPPQPPVEEHTTWIAAGAVEIGVEWRDIEPADLEALYGHDDAMLAELRASSPEEGFRDAGVSLHVRAFDDGHEYVRFDVFAEEPHYHYIHCGDAVANQVVHFDVAAHGAMLPWALERLRSRLPAMLTRAGGSATAELLDDELLSRAVGEVERHVLLVARRPPPRR
jgi:hypothetical protein